MPTGNSRTPNDGAAASIVRRYAAHVGLEASNIIGTRRTLFEKLQPLSPDRKLEIGETGDIALRSGQARDESGSNRINNLHENDRNRERLLPRGAGSARRSRKYYVGTEFNNVGCQRR
jgi:hypothetical protein